MTLKLARVSEHALDNLRKTGAILIDVDLRPWAQTASQTMFTLVTMHAVQDLADFLAKNVPTVSLDQVVAGVVSKDVRAMLRGEIAEPVTAARAEEAIKLRPKLARQYQEFFQSNRISALVYPTVPVLAPKIRTQGDAPEDLIDVNGKQLLEFATVVRNTHVSSIPGTPSLTVPAGVSSSGLPVGVSLEGMVGDDSRLLRPWAVHGGCAGSFARSSICAHEALAPGGSNRTAQNSVTAQFFGSQEALWRAEVVQTRERAR